MKRPPADTPVYGIERVEGAIEERAAEYVPKLLELHKGPFILAGWSLGGALAYACAIGLKRAGADVRFVGLIDLALPGEPIDQSKEGMRARWDRYALLAQRTFKRRDSGDPLRGAGAARRRGPGEVRSGRHQGQRCADPGRDHPSTSARRTWTSGPWPPSRSSLYDGHVTLYLADRYHDDAIVFEPAYATRKPDGGWGEYV